MLIPANVLSRYLNKLIWMIKKRKMFKIYQAQKNFYSIYKIIQHSEAIKLHKNEE